MEKERLAPPIIYKMGLSKEEQALALEIDSHFFQLRIQVGRFESAFELLRFSSYLLRQVQTSGPVRDELKRRQAQHVSEWRWIGFRDAAMTLYNVHKVFEALKSTSKRAKTVDRFVDWEKIRSAQKLFSKNFPNVEGVRNTVGHAGEAATSERARHAFSGDISEFGEWLGRGDVKSGSLTVVNGTKYTSPYKGSLVSFDLSDESVSVLKAILDMIFDAFEAAEEGTRELQRRVMRGEAKPAGE